MVAAHISSRRTWLKTACLLAGSVLLMPWRAWAQSWQQAAFDAPNVNAARQALGLPDNISTDVRLQIIAPQRAENGNAVPIEIISQLPQTTDFWLFSDKNPVPLIAHYQLAPAMQPRLKTRIKLAEDATLLLIARTPAGYFSASQNVQVMVNGCE